MYTVIACNTRYRQVEEKVSKMQRRYFLQEQLKIIKRELGLEVRNEYLLIHVHTYMYVGIMCTMYDAKLLL